MSLKANEGKKYISRLDERSASPRQTKLGISKKKKKKEKEKEKPKRQRK
jgi:hypothetical protein